MSHMCVKDFSILVCQSFCYSSIVHIFLFWPFKVLLCIFLIVLLVRGPDFLGLDIGSNNFIPILMAFAIPGIVLFVFREKKIKKGKIKETVADKVDSFIPFQWAMPWIIIVIMLSVIIGLAG